jgi:geranylgeranyl pyrophosphate synthase
VITQFWSLAQSTEPYRDQSLTFNALNLRRYFFEVDGGKKIRPAMVLGVSYALNNHLMLSSTDEKLANEVPAAVATPAQKRLAEITEMIHTASLFHDDVIDKVLLTSSYLICMA